MSTDVFTKLSQIAIKMPVKCYGSNNLIYLAYVNAIIWQANKIALGNAVVI